MSDGSKALPEHGTTELRAEPVTLSESNVEAPFKETEPENETAEVGNRGESENASKIEDSESPVLPEVGERELRALVSNEVSASNQEALQDMASTGEGNQTAQDLNEPPRVTNGDDAIECSSDQEADTSYSQKEVNDVVVIDHKEKVTMGTTARQELGEVREDDKRNGVELVSDTPVNDDSVPDTSIPQNDSVVSTGLESPTFPLYESLSSGDEFRMLEKSSNYLRSDSYETDTPETPGEIGVSKESEEEKHDEDFHAPLFADTWSSRALPTAHAIESLAISENYVFCMDARGAVYYSDPNSASCHGWEQVDWKATQMCVDGSGDLIGYVGKDSNAYVRANVGVQYPVGNKSFQIMEDVSTLITCSVCTWAITTNGGLRRADTCTLLELKGDLKKHAKIWRHEDSPTSFCQIACYNDVLWARTVDESLFVYAGIYLHVFMYITENKKIGPQRVLKSAFDSIIYLFFVLFYLSRTFWWKKGVMEKR